MGCLRRPAARLAGGMRNDETPNEERSPKPEVRTPFVAPILILFRIFHASIRVHWCPFVVPSEASSRRPLLRAPWQETVRWVSRRNPVRNPG